MAETLDGLASAHQAGVVHRDIKPENILINDRGHVQITDFGLARAISQATLSSTGLLLGTAAYLAPELIENNLATPQGDLYSAGMMAWEMLAGRVPFTADNPVTLVFKHVHENTPSISTACPDINEKVAQFISKLTARDMNDRPDNAIEALTQLRNLSKQLSAEDWQYKIDAVKEEQDSDSLSPLDNLRLKDIDKSDSDNKTKDYKYSQDSDDSTSDLDATQAISTAAVKSEENTDSDSQSNPLEEFDDSNMPTIAIDSHELNRNKTSINTLIPTLQLSLIHI